MPGWKFKGNSYNISTYADKNNVIVDNLIITQHALQRVKERNISLEAIRSGKGGVAITIYRSSRPGAQGTVVTVLPPQSALSKICRPKPFTNTEEANFPLTDLEHTRLFYFEGYKHALQY